MSEWNAMSYEGRDTIIRTVRAEAEALLRMAETPGAWEAPTGSAGWQVRDVVGHLVDVTEGYFDSFDIARGGGQAPEPFGLAAMATRLDERARAFRDSSQAEMTARLRADFTKMMEIIEGIGPDEWAGLTVPHSYMGPLPAFFYPAAQLMDYTVHGWDVRQGTGKAHGVNGDAADLLVPFMFVLWQSTATVGPDTETAEVGVRVTGRNGGDFRLSISPDGLAYEATDIDGCPAVIEFDPGSFVLTVFGRGNFGTLRGDRDVAERMLNLFFRI
ncbi:MAG TPA: maleylpyruvate isomerase N-terminal domain-containing protein [Mycobacteriales bacterium]|nr:maleylpyruvate isomerase N-terminal domain-containing protein [Mycobacteriales bacterium]